MHNGRLLAHCGEKKARPLAEALAPAREGTDDGKGLLTSDNLRNNSKEVKVCVIDWFMVSFIYVDSSCSFFSSSSSPPARPLHV